MALFLRPGVVPLVVPHAGWVDGRSELDPGDGMIAVSPLFIAVFMLAAFLLAGGWAVFRPPRRRDEERLRRTSILRTGQHVVGVHMMGRG